MSQPDETDELEERRERQHEKSIPSSEEEDELYPPMDEEFPEGLAPLRDQALKEHEQGETQEFPE